MQKVVIIGAGSICRTHIDAFEGLEGERARVVAIVSRSGTSARRLIEERGMDARAYTDYREALEKEECDIVSICTPPAAHREMAVYCLRAGKHVLVEKPMASSLEECRSMIEAAEEAGKKLGVIAQSRFMTPVWRTKKLLDSGICGRLLYTQVNSFWYRGRSYYDLAWRGQWSSEGGGCTLVHAVHHIDLLNWMAGMPERVTAVLGNVAHDNSEEEDLSMALLQYPDGTMAQITASLVCHGQRQALLFAGERASMEIPHRFAADTPMENGFPQENSSFLKELEEAYQAVPALRYEGHKGQADDFVRAVETDGPVLIGGEDGYRTMELIMAIYQSAAENRTVTLPIMPGDPFYTREGITTRMPHFYEKTTFLERFEKDDIVLASTNLN